jgi:hypothetical protein
MTDTLPPPDAQLLSDAIAASGRSVRSFGRTVLKVRDERAIWRWLSGEKPLPPEFRTLCQQIVAAAQAVGPLPAKPARRKGTKAPTPNNSTTRNNEPESG